MANSDVKLKHKVQLRKKVEEEPQPVVAPKPESTPTLEPENSKSNKWIWWVVGVIVLCIIGYFLFSKSEKEQPAQTETEVVEEVSAVESVDEATDQPEGVQDEANSEEASEATQTEQPAAEPKAEAPVTNVVTEQTQPKATESASVSNDVEAEAIKVIRGEYGIGQERKDKLGAKYQPIQNRVNELKREGVF
ncbi:hypothetical protein EEL49_08920 [Muribaculaceae bacterium Isolate-104 (HZI)]|nr:hypothetical protein EEL49_08920 [Muribaculaceae bacterium Isolate-104 (HZI)]